MKAFLCEEGLIPAHAGKTSLSRSGLVAAWGSSPLTRGKLARNRRLIVQRRLIPAHAGKTAPRCGVLDVGRAHPRSRGENRISHGSCAAEQGSSPLTRGKPAVGVGVGIVEGLIPAHAGKTGPHTRRLATVRAHPRSRGENPDNAASTPGEVGSSPLTRGKRKEPWYATPADGLIPAHAGKTRRVSAVALATQAHPRSRGENVFKSGADQMKAGSSPLTRGKPFARKQTRKRSGLIPAHAGKTFARNQQRDRLGAHPRSRGENSLH